MNKNIKYPFFKGYRAHLVAKCPCGKSNKDGKFVPFLIDNKVSQEFGYCHSCNESFFPQTENKKMNTINQSKMLETINIHEMNGFNIWFKSSFAEFMPLLASEFFVGNENNGATLFWYINYQKQLINAKVITYESNGHRNKSKSPYFRYKSEDGFGSCLYLEHLLINMQKTVVLVESEKSAIVGNCVFPEYIWLATGGASALTESKAKVLSNRKIILFPDMDEAGRKSIVKNTEILNSVKCKVSVVDINNSRNDGADIVDLIDPKN